MPKKITQVVFNWRERGFRDSCWRMNSNLGKDMVHDGRDHMSFILVCPLVFFTVF